MSSPRWVIFRRLLLVLIVGAGLAWAGRKEPASPVPAAAPTPAAPPSLPEAGPLFAAGLPIPSQAVPEGVAHLSAQSCAACHAEVHERWSGSAHARAWSEPRFQLALERVGQTTACLSCHLPLQNQHPRLARGYIDGDLSRPELEKNPGWEPSLMIEGVTCAACHVREGKVLTARPEVIAAPHPLAYSAELGQSELCATCHQLSWPGADKPLYDTYGEWRSSAYAEAGIGCADCHMPARAGNASASRFAAVADHAFPASTARALTILLRPETPELTRGQPWRASLRLLNTGAGHHLPTGSPFVGWRVVVVLRGPDDKPLAPIQTLDLARDIADAPPWTTLADSRLPAGGERALDVQLNLDPRARAGRATLAVEIYAITSAERLDPKWSVERAGPPLHQQRIPITIL